MAGALDQPQHALRRATDIGFGDLMSGDRLHQQRAEIPGRPRHLEVQTPRDGDGTVRPEPIGDDRAVEAPLFFQQALEQLGMLAAVRTAQPVVRAHQAPHAGAEHRGFERWQVQLAQRPFGNLHADREALVLLVVAYEVLDARTDAALLDAFDVGDCHLGGEIRIFRKAFEVASVQWMAVNVHRRSEQHTGTFRARLVGEHASDTPHQVAVPRCCQRRSARQAGGRSHRPTRPARAGRAVGHAQRGDADPVDRRGVPEVDARGQGGLLFQGQASLG